MSESLLTFREIIPEDYSEIVKLLEELSWNSYPFKTNPALFKKLLDNTDRSVVALEGSQLVGIATAMCNNISVGYITMLAVSPDKQGRGLGSKLANKLMGESSNIKWILSSIPENDPFWEKQGFIRWPLMVKGRKIDQVAHKDPELTSKRTFKTIIYALLRKIYTLNIYQCHIGIKRLIQRTLR